MLERITELAAPPVVGRSYHVPCVFWEWGYYAPRWWPVFLPLHEDVRFFNFADEHYHIDPRFVAKRYKETGWGAHSDDPLFVYQVRPIARHRSGEWNRLPGPVEWRRRRCNVSEAPYVVPYTLPSLRGKGLGPASICLHWQGQTAQRNRHGWVCPHQHAALGSVGPDAEGVITCPLHGLRLRASDGLCLGPPSTEPVQ